MNNLLPSSVKLHQKYDLKGSTYKRKVCNILYEYLYILYQYNFMIMLYMIMLKILGIETRTFEVFTNI